MPQLFRPEATAKTEGVLHFDGACSPNPGPASCGFVLRFGTKVIERTVDLGHGTNNIAEYEGLIRGMRCALENGVTHLECYGDSMIVIRGLTKRKRSPLPHIQALKRTAIELAERFQHVEFFWVPREQNSEADALSSHR